MLLNPYRFGVSGPTDPYFSNVSLLMHMDGTNGSTTFTDSGPAGVTLVAVNSAQISTAQSKFGGASGLFDGVTDYVSAGSSSALDLSGAPYTIEFWTYLSSVGTTQIWYSQFSLGIEIGVDPGGDIYFQPDGTTFITTGAGGLVANAWQHVAATYDGTTTRIFVDGVQKASGVLNDAGSANVAAIGARYNTAFSVNGYIDDLRVTKGIARYTSGFTPPIAAFPDA